MNEDRAREAVRYLVERMALDAGHRGLTGISSDALVVAAFTGVPPARRSYPSDRADWRRCLIAYAGAVGYCLPAERALKRQLALGEQFHRCCWEPAAGDHHPLCPTARKAAA